MTVCTDIILLLADWLGVLSMYCNQCVCMCMCVLVHITKVLCILVNHRCWLEALAVGTWSPARLFADQRVAVNFVHIIHACPELYSWLLSECW